ncbi:FG-GAP-like repeat-containing protein [Pyxidicoccus xibeiensis]|uniref:FG-GAP-like repeat-containing protein n=1 Tax=Pyxidicoccus xibeiensis TaxID=2906759 RepID=UPI0020A7B54A|nr:FG-GAP-like repeat-containing protein [Pyxidicoccus xibeiensis]MCP3143973.1 FG-GAP-like repeat-containing protein [Pyxidicoccus xibeiensis]
MSAGPGGNLAAQVYAPLHTTPRVERWGWTWPRWNDARLPFAGLLTLYGVLGFTFFGFNRSPWQMATIVVTGSLLDMALGWLLKREKVVPLSAYISCCSLALLLNYSHSSWLLFLPVWLAIGSKYVLTFQGRHVFNPSMFAVATSLLLTRELITAAPAYQWANGEVALSAFIVMAALVLFFFRVGRGWLVVSFLGFYALQTAARAYVMRHHLPPEVLFLGTLGAPSFFIFVFYMLTDPATSPGTRRGQVLLALAVTVVDAVLHFKESVYTFFYAALTVATLRFLFLHARAAWQRGVFEHLKGLLSPAWLKRAAVVGGLGAVMVVGYSVAAAPGARTAPLAFKLERLDAASVGLGSTMGRTLDELDPRLAHVSKWLVAVGDAVATGDYDGDGKLDLFLSHPLATPEHHAGLYRNLGDFRFERVAVPALERFATRYKEEGLAGGGTFVDWDGDGDADLAVAVAFGPVRLLRNTLRETGVAGFEDVTVAAGVADHAVSLGLTFLDYDRDGHLDLLVLNAMTTHLPDYAPPVPLNLFRLPDAEHPGDRRMFRFMHDGWHDADNGGLKALYRGRGDGTFQKQDAAALGLGDTRWSLAVSTVDMNRDGWTDLYVANDFGPDDVYLNEAGRRFRRVAGRLFGEIGKDTYKGMNASVADFDRNGWLDVYVSNVHHSLQAEGSLLWMLGPGKEPFVPTFRDEATFRGALNERRFGWGAAAGDLDNDGWPDLVQANGMVDDRLDGKEWRIPDGQRKDYWYVNHKLMQSGPEMHTYADKWGDIRGRTIYPNEARRAYLNLGDAKPGHFVDVARELGVEEPENSRGVLLADLDGDGDLDTLITNQHAPVSVYRNTLRDGATPAAHFVGLSLVGNGTGTHRSAVGTRVVVSYDEGGRRVEQVREVGLMGGFSASADPRLHFGLGRHAGPVTAQVHWYGGGVQQVTLEPDRYHELRQPADASALRGSAQP